MFDNEASSSTTEQRSLVVSTLDSEIDFKDVYGGPPMWTRYSYSGRRIKPWEESTCSPTGSVPVFGEPHDWRSSDVFYQDVFRRSKSAVSRRSKSVRPAKIEPFPTSIPAEFSLPVKMTKTADIPEYGLHTTNTHLSTFSSPATQLLRRNSLSAREPSSMNESLHLTRSTQTETNHKSKPKTGSVSSEFHFSMHKWANAGVPLLMSTLKGSNKVSAQDMNPVSENSLLEVIEKDTLS